MNAQEYKRYEGYGYFPSTLRWMYKNIKPQQGHCIRWNLRYAMLVQCFRCFIFWARSRYSRVERSAVCAAFVFLSMLCSAMWYSTIPDQPMGEGFFKLGPFSLTTEKVRMYDYEFTNLRRVPFLSYPHTIKIQEYDSWTSITLY